MVNTINLWLRSLRAYFFAVSVIPVLICFILAKANGVLVGFLELILMLVALLSVHLATSLVNECHYSKKGVDINSKLASSKVLLEGLLKRKQAILLLICLYLVSAFIAVFFIFYSSFNLFWYILIGLFVCYFYTAGKNPLKHIALGEFAVFFLLGPLLFFGIYYAFSAELSFRAFLFSVPIGLQITAILTANNIKYINDEKINIEKFKYLYYVELIFPYFLLFLLVFIRVNHFALLLIFLSIIRVLKLVVKMHINHLSEEIVEETAQLQSIFSVLMFIGLLFDFWFK